MVRPKNTIAGDGVHEMLKRLENRLVENTTEEVDEKEQDFRPQVALYEKHTVLGISNLCLDVDASKNQKKLLIGSVQGGKTNAFSTHLLFLQQVHGYTLFPVVLRNSTADVKQFTQSFNDLQIDFFGKQVIEVVYIRDELARLEARQYIAKKPLVVVLLGNDKQLPLLKKALHSLREEKICMVVDESDFLTVEVETRDPSKTSTFLSQCVDKVNRTLFVTATPYTHLIHNQDIVARDIVFLTVGKGYQGLNDIKIVPKKFPKRLGELKTCWDDPEIKETVSHILNSTERARVLVSVHNENVKQKKAVQVADIPKGAVFFTFIGEKNVIRANGIDLGNLECVNGKSWDPKSIELKNFFDALEALGATHLVVFAHKLAARGISFTGLTHQILVRSSTTVITNLYQAVRLLGYKQSEEEDQRVLYCNESIRTELEKLRKFEANLRTRIKQFSPEVPVSRRLRTEGLEYESFNRSLASERKGKIKQTPVRGADAETNTLKTWT